MGTIYQVDDENRNELENLDDLSDWYNYMGAIGLEDTIQCDLEDSWPLWREATQKLDSPLSLLFVGELRPNEYEGGDPSVGFIGASAVRDIHNIFQNQGKAYFSSLIKACGFSSDPDIWLYEELRDFFENCSKKDKAVLFFLS